jgi:hypothetical protein
MTQQTLTRQRLDVCRQFGRVFTTTNAIEYLMAHVE